LEYYHVDVFTDTPLYGNGLTVVFINKEIEDSLLLKIAQEFKQFETVFVYPIIKDYYPIRIFTVQEELSFAGHPIIGTAAILHKKYHNTNETIKINIGLNNRIVKLQSTQKDGWYSAIMNQGIPKFITTINDNNTYELVSYFSLSLNDVDRKYPIEVVSTGLEYILVPVKTNIEHAKIVKAGLEEYISKYFAKFVYLFNPETLECRCWDNTGMYEDVATGSAAGPLIAYLVKNKYFEKNEMVTLAQGKWLGRPSRITGWVTESEIFIEGKVAFFGEGEICI
jgi:trans-2,3-dihydro-3-hydroxyanthranilate isomerase